MSSQSYGFSSSHVRMWELDYKEMSAKELMLLNCGVGEDSWESLGLQEDPTSPGMFYFSFFFYNKLSKIPCVIY